MCKRNGKYLPKNIAPVHKYYKVDGEETDFNKNNTYGHKKSQYNYDTDVIENKKIPEYWIG